MNAPPCPYCGNSGYHTWAGEGGCPGAASERERDALAAFYLENLNRQNAALRLGLERERTRNLGELKGSLESALPLALKNLLARAADALAYEMLGRNAQIEFLDHSALIAELRKAAQ